MLRNYLLASVLVAGLLAVAGPAIAAFDFPDNPAAVADLVGTPPADSDAIFCDAGKVPAYAIDVLFTEAVDLTLCEPALLEATGECLAAVNFGADTDDLVVVDIHLLGCAESGRSPPG